jgi:hypothetical protein
MKNKILVFDDIIDLEYQEKIKKVLLSDYEYKGYEFPWYFTQDVTNPLNSNTQKRSAFYHGYVVTDDDTIGTIDSVFHYLFVPLIDNSCSKIGKQDVTIIKGRSFLQLPINFKGEREDLPHVDIVGDHFVMLYYVCDSDGDTIIYNYKTKKEGDVPFFEDVKELKRITPKQGRVVIFDGMYWHTAEQPTKDIRCIINFNISTNGT